MNHFAPRECCAQREGAPRFKRIPKLSSLLYKGGWGGGEWWRRSFFFFFLLFCHYLQAFIAGADEVMRGLAPVRVHNQILAFGEQRGEHLHTGKGGESAVEVHCCVSVITALILPVFYSGNLNTATPFRVTLLNTQTKIAPKKASPPPRTTAHFLSFHFFNSHTDRAGDVFPERRRPLLFGIVQHSFTFIISCALPLKASVLTEPRRSSSTAPVFT